MGTLRGFAYATGIIQTLCYFEFCSGHTPGRETPPPWVWAATGKIWWPLTCCFTISIMDRSSNALLRGALSLLSECTGPDLWPLICDTMTQLLIDPVDWLKTQVKSAFCSIPIPNWRLYILRLLTQWEQWESTKTTKFKLKELQLQVLRHIIAAVMCFGLLLWSAPSYMKRKMTNDSYDSQVVVVRALPPLRDAGIYWNQS